MDFKNKAELIEMATKKKEKQIPLYIGRNKLKIKQ